jgi:hypothetical protein
MATGEVIDREMTNAEHTAWLAQQAEAQSQAEAQVAKAIAKQAVIAKLGLTADEVAALLS